MKLLLLIFCFNFFVSTCWTKVIKVPLTRKVNILSKGKYRPYSTFPYVNEVTYSGPITIGTPPQKFNVIFNTGLPFTWVPIQSCNDRSDNNYYNRWSSSTSKSAKMDTTNMNYGYGSLIGTYLLDNYCVLGVCIPQQNFAAASSKLGLQQTADGYLGLGFSTLAPKLGSPSIPTFMDNLFTSKLVSANTFGLNLNGKKSGGPNIILGGYDKSQFTGELTYLKSDNIIWDAPFGGFDVGGSIFMSNKGPAWFDSGITHIMGPVMDMERLNRKLGGTRVRNTELYTIPCSKIPTLPKVVIKLGGHDFPLSPETYVIKNGNVCHSGFYGSFEFYFQGYKSPFIVLGNIFFQEYYGVFVKGKQNQVGLAPSL